LVVTKLDCLARSLPDARDISAELAALDVRLSLGGAVHDPTDPVGRLRGRRPKLSSAQEKHLVQLHTAGTHTVGELAELFSIGRATVYRAVDRSTATPAARSAAER
jgi:DNA invertase Pin-like site-specific DNA recombinase